MTETPRDDGSNLLEELGVALSSSQLATSIRLRDGYQLLKLTTGEALCLAAATSVHWGRVRRRCFYTEKPCLELVGANLDPKSMLGTISKGAVDYTVVNGKIVVRNGKLTKMTGKGCL